MPLRRLLFELSRCVSRRGDGGEWSKSGDGRARTGDPLLAKQVLSQLSYAPMQMSGATVRPQVRRRAWAFLDSNQRPHGYQPCALTN